MKKPEILIFTDWFLPGYKAGGPIRSIANLVRSLENHFGLYIVTGNTDFGVSQPYPDVIPNQWQKVESFQVIYLDFQHQTFSFYKKLLNERNYSSIYLNSLFSVKFTLLPMLALKFAKKQPQKVVLAPRGMLGKGALQLKQEKKRVFLWIIKKLSFFDKITWHATTFLEHEEIVAVFGQMVKINVINNLPDKKNVPKEKRREKEPGKLSLFFLSRVSRKKNLKYALECIQGLPETIQVSFNIYGPIEDAAYWEECQILIEKINKTSHLKAKYIGAVENQNLHQIIKDEHVLFLPTLNENYGHVIVEAFLNSGPVIISDQTPWRNLQEKALGLDIPLQEKAQFIKAIVELAELGQGSYDALSKSCYNYGQQILNNSSLIEEYIKLFSVELEKEGEQLKKDKYK